MYYYVTMYIQFFYFFKTEIGSGFEIYGDNSWIDPYQIRYNLGASLMNGIKSNFVYFFANSVNMYFFKPLTNLISYD